MSVNKKTVSDHDKTAFAIVGELVMMSTALDHLLNQVLITVLDLGTSEWLEPVTATLDPKRKLEILRGRAAHMPPDVDWKTALIKFCDMVDIVFTKRNIVCHIPPFLDGEVWKFVPVAAAKMLKNLDLSAKTVRAFPLNDLKSAIATGETALASGMAIITNFRLVNAEIRRARAPAGVSSENYPSVLGRPTTTIGRRRQRTFLSRTADRHNRPLHAFGDALGRRKSRLPRFFSPRWRPI